jgi:hypothetical protein
MNPAKLPAKLVEKPERHLEDLEIAESGWVDWLEMAVDKEYSCYIDPKARVRSSRTITTVQVTRREEGFEVRIPTTGVPSPLRWKRGAYNSTKDAEHYKRYVPVIKVEEIQDEE